MKKINLNSPVKVRLTDYGREIYYHRFDKLNAACEAKGYGSFINPSYPKTDEEGFSVFQLHDLARTFGEYITITAPPVIEHNAMYISDKELEPVFGMEPDWKQEAQKQASAAGLLRIQLTQRLEEVTASARATMNQLKRESNTDTMLSLNMKLKTLRQEIDWLESILVDPGKEEPS